MPESKNEEMSSRDYSLLAEFLHISAKVELKAVDVQNHLLCSLALALRGSRRRC